MKNPKGLNMSKGFLLNNQCAKTYMELLQIAQLKDSAN
jgi:hypothetical protein